MSHPSPQPCVQLGRQDFLRFDDRRARRLHAGSGTLWVTVDGQPEDIEINAGQSRSFDGRAALTVGTLGGPAVLCTQLLPEPGGRQHGWAWPQLRGLLS